MNIATITEFCTLNVIQYEINEEIWNNIYLKIYERNTNNICLHYGRSDSQALAWKSISVDKKNITICLIWFIFKIQVTSLTCCVSLNSMWCVTYIHNMWNSGEEKLCLRRRCCCFSAAESTTDPTEQKWSEIS